MRLTSPFANPSIGVRTPAVPYRGARRRHSQGTDYLLSAGQAVGVRRVVAQSYFAAYARTGGPVKSEEDRFDPSPAREMRETLAAIRHLEEAVLDARWTVGIVLRYGAFYGPGTSMAPGAEQLELIRKRRFPLVGDGGGKASELAQSLRGSGRVARTVINGFRVAARHPEVSLRPKEINGGPRALLLDRQQWRVEQAPVSATA